MKFNLSTIELSAG